MTSSFDSPRETFTNADGKQCEIDCAFAEGNTLVHGDDDNGFKIDDFYLKARRCVGMSHGSSNSSVFRSMMSSDEPTSRPILIPGTTKAPLKLFLSGLTDRLPTSISWSDAGKAAIKLCDIYDCPSIARVILYNSIGSLQYFEYQAAFYTACKLSDVPSAARILSTAYGSRKENTKSNAHVFASTERLDEERGKGDIGGVVLVFDEGGERLCGGIGRTVLDADGIGVHKVCFAVVEGEIEIHTY